VRSTSATAWAEDVSRALEGIVELIRARAGFDLSGYKSTPMLWRIQRRMDVRGVSLFRDYETLLHDDLAELETLIRGIPIHVTEFFRDPAAWEVLRQDVIPALFQEAGSEPVRAWTSACSTGEEAYSLAMLLAEHAGTLDRPVDFQVFATDASAEIVARASRGMFRPAVVNTLSLERRQRFFYGVDHGFRVRRDLRQKMVFAPQDVLADPPFPGLDLVTCRNLLIYLERDAAARVVSVLHSSLRMGGCLFLGRGESLLTRQVGGFTEVVPHTRIYRKTGPMPGGNGRIPTRPARLGRTRSSRSAIEAHAHAAALEDGELPAVLVDEHFQILRFYGDTRGLLRFLPGEPSLNLRELVPAEAHLDLAAKRVRSEQRAVTISNLPDPRTDAPTLSIRVTPLEAPEGDDLRFLVSFIRGSDAGPGVVEPGLPTTPATRVPERLGWSEALRLSHEELDASREELQALNEELRASNDQLNIANEDLSQAVIQLRDKVAELETQSDILSSGAVMTMFLDADLRIGWFTPAIRELFPLQEGDAGRPITDLVPTFRDPDFLGDVQAVIATGLAREGEVRTSDGRWYIKRIRPFRTKAGSGSGVAVIFTDITDRRRASEIVRESEARLAADLAGMQRLYDLHARIATESDLRTALDALLEAACDFTHTDRGCIQLVSADGSRVEMFAHRGYDDTTSPFVNCFRHRGFVQGYDAARVERRVIIEDTRVFPGLAGTEAGAAAQAENLLAAQSTLMVSRKGEALGVLSTHFSRPHRPSEDELRLVDLIAWTGADFVERHRAAEAVRHSEERLRLVLETEAVGVLFFNYAGTLIDANDVFLRLSGWSREDVAGGRLDWRVMTPPEYVAASEAQMRNLAATGRIGPYEKEYLRKDGTRSWMLFTGRDLGDGTIVE
jgi:two-component system CheB/CheR fusion protein